MSPHKFVFWDTETTGLSKAFHMPVEIGGVVANESLSPVREFELSCRPTAFVLPEPKALVVTGRSIHELLCRDHSAYQAIGQLTAEVRAVTPTCFVTFNGISFDDPLIQHAFYRNLHDPYSMMKGGNRRLDMLKVVHVAHVLGEGTVNVPHNDDGKPVFKLDAVAPLNGFQEAGAHSACVDARATLHLAQVVRGRAPAIWERAVNLWSNKDAVRELLSAGEPVVLFEWDGKGRKAVFKALMPIAAGRNYAGEFLCLDLAFEPSEYTSLSAEELVDKITIGSRPRPICPLRLNAMPIVFALNDPLIASRIPCTGDVLMSRARQLQADPGLQERILIAADIRRAQFSEPQHVDEQLYSGGFVTQGDVLKLEQFHCVYPDQKMRIIAGFEDPRLRRLATRVMYEEWPSALACESREQVAIEAAERLHAGLNAPWTTFASALRDIDKLLAVTDEKGKAILLEYREHIIDMSSVAYAAE